MTIKQKWKTTFFIIAGGQAVSLLGSSGVQFALVWWLAERTASPMMLGMAGLAAFLPMTFLSPLAGVMADRHNRKYICIISDMSMGVLALIYAALLWFFDLPAWTVLAVLCARGIGGTFQQPAIQSIIPQLVPSEQLVRTNGWMQLMNSGSFILGPVIGAALYAVIPIWAILLTDVIGAAAASLALAVVKVPKLKRHIDGTQHVLRQFKEGLAVYKEDEKLLFLVLCEALCMFFFAPLSSFYPLMTSNFFGLSAIYGSIVETAFAVGMMLTALLFSSVWKVKKKIRVSYIGMIGVGAATAVSGLVPPVYAGWVVFTICCAFLGAFGNVHNIPLMAYIQETVAQEKMGRAISLLTLISSLTMPIGLLIASPIAEKAGVHTWFLVSGISILVITGGILWLSRLRLAKTKNQLRKG